MIGINRYDRSPLKGCIADADDFNDFLVNTVGANQNDIINLRDWEEESKNPPRGPATRANIIAKIQSFKNNGEIRKGDPIVIYFAGHGGQSPYLDWKATHPTSMIESICPVDIHKFPDDKGREPEVKGIPDFTLRALLNELSREKGNNIVSGKIFTVLKTLLRKI